MTTRETLTELTLGCRTQADLDAVIARYTDFGTMRRAVCPGCCDPGEFLHEWDNVKLRIRRTARSAIKKRPAHHRPCRRCEQQWTPAETGAMHGMPCRRCLLVMLGDCQIQAAQEKTPDVRPTPDYSTASRISASTRVG